MKLIYADNKIEELCTSVKAAKKFFGGNSALVTSLHARINAMKKAVTIHDIIMMPQFHFHKLYNKAGKNYEGTYAIDVKSRDDQWRVIVEPLDEDEKPFDSCHIDELSRIIKVVKIREVSKHYE